MPKIGDPSLNAALTDAASALLKMDGRNMAMPPRMAAVSARFKPDASSDKIKAVATPSTVYRDLIACTQVTFAEINCVASPSHAAYENGATTHYSCTERSFHNLQPCRGRKATNNGCPDCPTVMANNKDDDLIVITYSRISCPTRTLQYEAVSPPFASLKKAAPIVNWPLLSFNSLFVLQCTNTMITKGVRLFPFS